MRNDWRMIDSLDVDHYLGACFVGYDIVYGLDSNARVVSYKYNPENKDMQYTRMQKYATGLKMSNKMYSVDKVKASRFNEGQFFAVIRRDLMRTNFSDLNPSWDSPS